MEKLSKHFGRDIQVEFAKSQFHPTTYETRFIVQDQYGDAAIDTIQFLPGPATASPSELSLRNINIELADKE